MDIEKSKKKATYKFWFDKRLIVAFGLLLAGIGFNALASFSEPFIFEDDISVGVVKLGDLSRDVDGFGYLLSSEQKLQTAFTTGTIEEIKIKPGIVVEPESVILVLSNPELQLTAEDAKQNLNQEKGNLRKIKMHQEKELLEAELKILQAQKEFNVAESQYKIEKSLVKDMIVSQIQFKKTKEAYLLSKEQLKTQKKLIAQMKLINLETIAIQEDKIKQAAISYQKELDRLESLSVKAGMKGVLQKLPVTLGQSVAPGDELFIVGSNDDLNAQIRVPQSQANLLKLGLNATIDTRKDKINGKVKRIDPTVKDGTVLVEIDLKKPLPKNLRSELNVEGRIHIEEYKNVLYLEKPEHVKAPTKSSLYKMTGDGKASSTPVSISQVVGSYVVIDEGATAGDSFILSISTNESKILNLKKH